MSKLSTLEAIGWFGLAKRFSGASQMIPVAIGTAILPTLTRMHSEGDRAGFAKMVWRMIGVLIVASLPISVVLVVFPGALLDLLRYPPGFAGSIPVMQLAGGALFIWASCSRPSEPHHAGRPSGRNTVFAYVTGLGALLAFPICGACIWAGERYLRNGAAGAMIGDIVLELVMLFFYARALFPDLFPSGPGPTATGPATAPEAT
ncbi:MAG: hypothetical protein U5K74_01595 [Gemmatimonadaceae bacterium]|nr:hypothetical protein [Gemmatimonadaceae bacterium]